MRFLNSLFSSEPKSVKPSRFSLLFNVLREHGIVIGITALALFLIGMVLFNGLIFYTNVIRPRKAATGRERKINLSEKSMADTLKLLDNREKEFNDILMGLSRTGTPTYVGGNIASSTRVR